MTRGNYRVLVTSEVTRVKIIQDLDRDDPIALDAVCIKCLSPIYWGGSRTQWYCSNSPGCTEKISKLVGEGVKNSGFRLYNDSSNTAKFNDSDSIEDWVSKWLAVSKKDVRVGVIRL